MYEFLQPTSLAEAVQKLTSCKNLQILAGGTDLIIAIKNKAITCDYLMDCKKIPELQVLKLGEEGLEIGAAVSVAEIIDLLPADNEYSILRQAALTLANVLLRNRATLVGNICNASPGGDMLPACLVLEGWLETVSPKGKRTILLKDFFLGVKKHSLEKDEMVTKVIFPKQNGKGIFKKKRRIRGHDLAQVSVAGFYSDTGTLRLAFGAAAPVPVLLDNLGVFTKQQLAEKRGEIIEKALLSVSPIDDIRSTKEYRIAMLKHFTGEIIDAFAQ